MAHDMGVPVAYAYAAGHRDAVERLVVLDVPLNGFGLDEFLVQHKLWHTWLFQVPGLPETLTAGHEREFLSHFYPLYNPQAITEGDIDEYVRCYAQPGAMHAGFEYYRAYPLDERRNREYAQTKLAIPVLALGGELSGGGAPFASFARLATDVRGGVIAGCGHFVPEEQPDALLAQALPFLTGS
jgi:pimeloyl-ACP methyl ester carboxylesterase